MSKIEWVSDGSIPDVKEGSMKYFLVATTPGKISYGAYYMNKYLLTMEDGCPEPDENGEPCKSCDDGEGHPCTGWHEETFNPDFDTFYAELSKSVIAWAHPPVFNPDGEPET